jgi:hypothetical protein
MSFAPARSFGGCSIHPVGGAQYALHTSDQVRTVSVDSVEGAVLVVGRAFGMSAAFNGIVVGRGR